MLKKNYLLHPTLIFYKQLQPKRPALHQRLCQIGVYVLYYNCGTRYNDNRPLCDLTRRAREDWEPRIGRTKYLCGKGFNVQEENILEYSEWASLTKELTSKFHGQVTIIEVYEQLNYLLDELERISECDPENPNVNFRERRSKPKNNIFTTEVNFWLICYSVGIYGVHVPSAVIKDGEIRYSHGYKIDYVKHTKILNICPSFSKSQINPETAEANFNDLWWVLCTTKISTKYTQGLLTNLKRPSNDDLRDQKLKKQKSFQ
jgi:hypothetical protein